LTVNKRAWSLLCALALVLTGSLAWGQADDNPPEVLTAELALKTVLESDRLDVTFVIVDTDNVVEFTIDGQKQKITPGDTVQVSHTFNFTKDVTRVVVTATDEKGHKRTVVYTVFRPGVNPATVAEKPKEAPLRVYGNYDVRYEQDTNPSNDLSSPVAIRGIQLTGVVPDSEQKDTRLNAVFSAGVNKGMWTAFAGGSKIDYNKDADNNYNVQTLYLGGSGAFALGSDRAFVMAYTFTDINLGGHDYDQTHTLSPGLRLSSQPEGGTANTLVGLDVVAKKFASDTQNNATDLTLRWDYNRESKDHLDTYARSYTLGTSSEGIDISKYNFLGFSWDWNNGYDSGLLWAIGFGFEYRKYPNDTPLAETFLGSTRVDVPGRFSFGIGYRFLPQLKIMGNYAYTANLSNKSPYVRQIYGISLNGAF
jgi:hypothetical protein